MQTSLAFAKGMANRDNPVRVFDWCKAARMIRSAKVEYQVSAGLQSDWEWTGGDIYRDGAPVPESDTYVYLASTWAIPEISIDGDVEECWIWEADSPGWGPHTYWPQEALDILNAVDGEVVVLAIEGSKTEEVGA